MKKIIPFIMASTLLISPTVFASETTETMQSSNFIDSTINEIKEGNKTESQKISDALTTSLVGAALGNNYSSEEIADFVEADGNKESADAIRSLDVEKTDFTTGMTDKWITAMLEKSNGQFGGFDTSQFITFDTDSSNLLNAKYKMTLGKLAENGWGQVPTDGVFSNTNGFQGYQFTADSGTSNAAELFGKEYSEILESMNNGTFMQSLDSLKQDMSIDKAKENVGFNQLQSTGVNLMDSLNNMSSMRTMIDSFASVESSETAKFANSSLYNAASEGLKSVDVASGMNAFANTPTTISAAFVSSQLDPLKGGIDSSAAGNFNSIKSSLSSAAAATKALNGVTARDANGLADVAGTASKQFNNAVIALDNSSQFIKQQEAVRDIAKNSANPLGLAADAFTQSAVGIVDGIGNMFGQNNLGEQVNGWIGGFDDDGLVSSRNELINRAGGGSNSQNNSTSQGRGTLVRTIAGKTAEKFNLSNINQ